MRKNSLPRDRGGYLLKDPFFFFPGLICCFQKLTSVMAQVPYLELFRVVVKDQTDEFKFLLCSLQVVGLMGNHITCLNFSLWIEE